VSSMELLPASMGFVLGALLTRLHSQHRLWVGIALILLLAASATVLSGEFLLSWGFLLVDIPLVGVATCTGFIAFRRMRSRHSLSSSE
jgi:hypothetical protein